METLKKLINKMPILKSWVFRTSIFISIIFVLIIKIIQSSYKNIKKEEYNQYSKQITYYNKVIHIIIKKNGKRIVKKIYFTTPVLIKIYFLPSKYSMDHDEKYLYIEIDDSQIHNIQ